MGTVLKSSRRFRAAVGLVTPIAVLVGLCGACLADGALFEYVGKPDPAFAWQLVSANELPAGTVYTLELTSQNWQGILWKHLLYVIKPKIVFRPKHALLFLTGGSIRDGKPSTGEDEVKVLAQVAQGIGGVVAVLRQVPNQPLYNDLSEDALISYTFERYMTTGDATWPLLLPMAKSAVKAMDATQAFAKDKLGMTIENFVVTGASKRGWTTWLTGAADSRVKGIAPMVIDVLNMAEQMPHQLEAWGAYSDEIGDYTERGMQERMVIPQGQKLNSIVDPFSYRDRLTMPKLILIGTNDPYWPVDAVNLYFDELKGEKHILYIPNAGHDLGDGREAIAGVAAFFMSVASGTPLPEFSWDVKRNGNSAVLTVKAEKKPIEVNLWSAKAPARDFRPSPWQKVPMSAGLENSYRANVAIPQTGHIAFYGELVYPIIGGQRYSLCTNMNVFGKE